MARVKIKGIENMEKRVRELFESLRRDPEMLDEIGVTAKNAVMQGTRAGKAETGKLDPLDEDTIRSRKQLAKYNQTHETYRESGRPSNLTFSGQLLNAIKYFVRPDKGQVTVEVADTPRDPYKTKEGKPIKGPRTNKELAEYVQKTRPFLSISPKTEQRIRLIAKAFIRRKLRGYAKIKGLIKK